ncbi:hypothetical protein GALL_249290 [mine drainage metagenome]|uniref:DUF6898 domain-containing protein n=1 Tax=mine drainage metagenome TaxID=410659 RepID=A0A1J5RMC6_9ZZZZ
MKTPPPDAVLFEFRRVGNAVKVSAVDPVSNTEISIVGSPTMGETTLKMAAYRKLLWVLQKNGA